MPSQKIERDGEQMTASSSVTFGAISRSAKAACLISWMLMIAPHRAMAWPVFSSEAEAFRQCEAFIAKTTNDVSCYGYPYTGGEMLEEHCNVSPYLVDNGRYRVVERRWRCNSKSWDGSYTLRPTSGYFGREGFYFPPSATLDEAKADGDPGCCAVGNPANVATGRKFQKEVDWTDPSGLLTFTRYYGSSPRREDLGLGQRWTFSFSRSVYFYSPTNQVLVQRDDGKLFQFRLDQQSGEWVPDADVMYRLTQVTGGWRVETPDFVEEEYDNAGRLVGLRTMSADSIALSYSGVKLVSVLDRKGRGLTFSYDPQGRIQSVMAPDGMLTTYSYDSNTGFLKASAHSFAGVTFGGRQYFYETASNLGSMNLLLDESGARYGEWIYDSNGRVVESFNGGPALKANRYGISYDATSRVVTDPLGGATSWGLQVNNGIQKLSSLSGTCVGCPNFKTRVLDSRGLTSSEEDHAGTWTAFGHNGRGLVISRTDNVNDAVGNKRSSETDWHQMFPVPIERRVYDASGNLVQKEVWTYNSRGQALTHAVIEP